MSFYGTHCEKDTQNYYFVIIWELNGSDIESQLEIYHKKDSKRFHMKTFTVKESDLNKINLWFDNFCYQFKSSEPFRSKVLAIPDFSNHTEIKWVSQANSKINKDISRLVHKFNSKRGAKFKDFAQLKSGKDKFSSIYLPELIKMVDTEVFNKIDKVFFDVKHKAVALRWLLRGLPLACAIRKVKTDIEIAENAAGGKKKP